MPLAILLTRGRLAGLDQMGSGRIGQDGVTDPL